MRSQREEGYIKPSKLKLLIRSPIRATQRQAKWDGAKLAIPGDWSQGKLAAGRQGPEEAAKLRARGKRAFPQRHSVYSGDPAIKLREFSVLKSFMSCYSSTIKRIRKSRYSPTEGNYLGR